MAFIKFAPIGTKLLKEYQVGFFVDTSGSTEGLILKVEQDLVESFVGLNNPLIVGWSTNAVRVADVRSLTSGGGTCPSCIFDYSETDMSNIDVAVLITDGQIDRYAINSFATHMSEKASHLKAVIGVIVAELDPEMQNPADVDASVLIPSMLSDSCIIFHNTSGESYMLWASGVLKTLFNPCEVVAGTTWGDTTRVNFTTFGDIALPTYDSVSPRQGLPQGYIPFGSGVFFSPDNLLISEPSLEEFLEYPFDRICQNFRVRHDYARLVTWFTLQKDRYIRDYTNDPSQFNIIDSLFQQPRRERNRVTISSFTQTRDRTLAFRYIADPEIEAQLDPRIQTILLFFRNMMQTLEEDHVTQEDARSYTMSSMAPSRYTSTAASMKTSSQHCYKPMSTHMTATFTEPHKWLGQFTRLYPDHNSLEVDCSICCEKSIPFILIRKIMETNNNIASVRATPLNYFYPEVVCSKCADYFTLHSKDPVRSPCLGAIPIVNLIGNSKEFFLTCLWNLTDYYKSWNWSVNYFGINNQAVIEDEKKIVVTLTTVIASCIADASEALEQIRMAF